MYIILDTETTGLPDCLGFNQFYHYEDNNRYERARLVQISWKVLKINTKCKKEYCREKYCSEDYCFSQYCFKDFIVKRDGFDINNTEFHGITNEISDSRGTDIERVLYELHMDLKRCKMIIAHNLNFDINILLNTFHRYKKLDMIEEINKKKKFCTMEKSKNILKLQFRRNSYSSYDSGESANYKYPSLSELYFYYFQKDIQNAHNSYYDTDACADCFCKIYVYKKNLLKKRKQRENELLLDATMKKLEL